MDNDKTNEKDSKTDPLQQQKDFISILKLDTNEGDQCFYNPFEHRVVDKPTTTLGALLHLLKGSLGTGILAMPNAFKNAGWLFGSIMTIFVGLLCTHSFWILVATSHKILRLAKTPMLGFAETAEKAFEYGPPWARRWSNTARNFVDYGLMLTYFSVGAVYIVFIANTFHDMLNYLLNWNMSVRIYILIVTVPILFIGQIRTLKFLVPFSGSANAFITVTFGIVLFYIFSDDLDFSNKPLITSWTTWPMFFSTVIFAMMGIGVVMPLENSMSKPQQFLGFPGVLTVEMIIITVMYFITGLLGFVRFGDKIEGSITLNLPTDDWPAITGQVLIGVAILFTFGLQFYVSMDILLKKLEDRIAKRRNVYEIGLRTGIIIILAALGVVVPDIGQFIGLVGAIFFSTLGLFVPACVETVFLQSHGGFGAWNWKLWKNIFLMLFSLIALVSGSFVSIKEIIDTYTSDEE